MNILRLCQGMDMILMIMQNNPWHSLLINYHFLQYIYDVLKDHGLAGLDVRCTIACCLDLIT